MAPRPGSIGFAIGSLGLASTAQAHSAFKGALPFYSGMLHVPVSPLGLAALVGFGAAMAASDKEARAKGVFLAALGAFAGVWIPQSLQVLATVGVIALGSGAALGLAPNSIWGTVLSALAGLAVGIAVQVDPVEFATASGVAVGTVLLSFWISEAFAYLQRKVPLARRIVGAWVTAIALLLGALTVRLWMNGRG